MKNEFPEGTKVLFTVESNYWVGETGRLVEGPDVEGHYQIFGVDHDDWHYFHRDEFEVIEIPAQEDVGSHYRYQYKGVKLDPYRVFLVWGVTDPALQHAIKKLGMAGQRGGKDFERDLLEAKASIERRLEMLGEDNESGT